MKQKSIVNFAIIGLCLSLSPSLQAQEPPCNPAVQVCESNRRNNNTNINYHKMSANVRLEPLADQSNLFNVSLEYLTSRRALFSREIVGVCANIEHPQYPKCSDLRVRRNDEGQITIYELEYNSMGETYEVDPYSEENIETQSSQ